MSSAGWFQQSMMEVEVIEARLRIGLIPSVDHAQLQWEVIDPRTAVVLGMCSEVHTPVANAREEAVTMLYDLMRELEGLVDPF